MRERNVHVHELGNQVHYRGDRVYGAGNYVRNTRHYHGRFGDLIHVLGDIAADIRYLKS